MSVAHLDQSPPPSTGKAAKALRVVNAVSDVLTALS